MNIKILVFVWPFFDKNFIVNNSTFHCKIITSWATTCWLYGTAKKGTFIHKKELTVKYGYDYIPMNWTVGTVAINNIKLSKTSIILKKKNQTYKIKVTFSPKNATNKKLSYKSSNKKVASVSKTGVIKAKKNGTAKITVKTVNGKKKTIKVTVKY